MLLMTKSLLLLFLSFGFWSAAQNKNSTDTTSLALQFDIKKMVLGDMNGDAIIDTAFVKMPHYTNEETWGDCKNDGCEIEISFSYTPAKIQLSNAVDAGVEAIGDVNHDGLQEIIVVPGWIIGCWGQYRFYTEKDTQWNEFGRANRYICEDEPYANCIVKRTKDYLTVEEDVMKNGDQAKQKKKLKIPKK